MNNYVNEEYKCTLDDKLLKRAKNELHEDPKNRLGAVETFRKWIKEQPHISCPTDTPFLLRFLRVAKFSQLVAREYLTNSIKLLTERPLWFANIDIHEERVMNFLRTGYFLFPERRDSHGRQVCIMRPAVIDPSMKTYDKADLHRAAYGFFMYYFAKEENQVCGFTFVVDLTGFSLAQSKVWTLDDTRLSGRMWNKCLPARLKSMNYYNHGPIFEGLFEMFKSFMSKKMKERVRFHGSNLESIYKVVPKECLPVEYLPDDYDGPNAGTIQDLIDDLIRRLTQPHVAEMIRRESDSNVTKMDLTAVKKDAIPMASFRKLNID